MHLVAVTPGVPMARVRERLGGQRAGLAVCVRVSPCGRLPVDPDAATRLTIVISQCAVSIHAADRLLAAATPGVPPRRRRQRSPARRQPSLGRPPPSTTQRRLSSDPRRPLSEHRGSSTKQRRPSFQRRRRTTVVCVDVATVPAWLRARFSVPVRRLTPVSSAAELSKG